MSDKGKSKKDKVLKSPRERFTTVGANRVRKALKAVDNLIPVSNRKSYEFSAGDVDKMNAALDAKVAEVKSAFKAALDGKTTPTKDNGFAF